jgi:hypothetical protein
MNNDGTGERPHRARCNAYTRGGRGATCQLPAGHRGTHSAVTYDCEDCGQTFRGRHGIAHGADAPDGSPYALNWCLPCAKRSGQWWPTGWRRLARLRAARAAR